MGIETVRWNLKRKVVECRTLYIMARESFGRVNVSAIVNQGQEQRMTTTRKRSVRFADRQESDRRFAVGIVSLCFQTVFTVQTKTHDFDVKIPHPRQVRHIQHNF